MKPVEQNKRDDILQTSKTSLALPAHVNLIRLQFSMLPSIQTQAPLKFKRNDLSWHHCLCQCNWSNLTTSL